MNTLPAGTLDAAGRVYVAFELGFPTTIKCSAVIVRLVAVLVTRGKTAVGARSLPAESRVAYVGSVVLIRNLPELSGHKKSSVNVPSAASCCQNMYGKTCPPEPRTCFIPTVAAFPAGGPANVKTFSSALLTGISVLLLES
jgi:hypothetical protein